jgi:hypothetical protein
MIADTLLEWVKHAVEAKAGEHALQELPRNQVSDKIRTFAEKRGVVGKSVFPGEIHFVIADVSSYYLQKPEGETHGPSILALAKKINEASNRYGVFVHYLSRQNVENRGADDGKGSPVTHAENGNTYVGIAGACNLAAEYISGFSSAKGIERLRAVRIDDDIAPGEPVEKERGSVLSRAAAGLRRLVARRRPSNPANIFWEINRALAGQIRPYGLYAGFFHSEQKPKKLRRSDRGEISYTAGIEEGPPESIKYARRNMSVPTGFAMQGHAISFLPDMLTHKGAVSTHYGFREASHGMAKNIYYPDADAIFGRLKPFTGIHVREVLRRSGIIVL